MIQGLLLAAGASTRFGSHKLLACLSENQTIGLASAIRLREWVDSIAAVVNPRHQPVIEMFQKAGIPVIACPLSQSGIGHSIACGVANTEDAEGWVIALADMPFIQPATIYSVVDAIRQGTLIAVPECNNKTGHPVGFSRSLGHELVQLTGDVGARALFSKYPSGVLKIPCHDNAIFQDVDTPADLPNLL